MASNASDSTLCSKVYKGGKTKESYEQMINDGSPRRPRSKPNTPAGRHRKIVGNFNSEITSALSASQTTKIRPSLTSAFCNVFFDVGKARAALKEKHGLVRSPDGSDHDQSSVRMRSHIKNNRELRNHPDMAPSSTAKDVTDPMLKSASKLDASRKSTGTASTTGVGWLLRRLRQNRANTHPDEVNGLQGDSMGMPRSVPKNTNKATCNHDTNNELAQGNKLSLGSSRQGGSRTKLEQSLNDNTSVSDWNPTEFDYPRDKPEILTNNTNPSSLECEQGSSTDTQGAESSARSDLDPWQACDENDSIRSNFNSTESLIVESDLETTTRMASESSTEQHAHSSASPRTKFRTRTNSSFSRNSFENYQTVDSTSKSSIDSALEKVTSLSMPAVQSQQIRHFEEVDLQKAEGVFKFANFSTPSDIWDPNLPSLHPLDSVSVVSSSEHYRGRRRRT